jgi:NAD(P)H-dependent FMN reductase
MRLTVINGSPRGQRSNTALLLDHFLAGFSETPGNSHETVFLANEKDHVHAVEAFGRAEAVLLAFPLYVDSMPAVTKSFIEKLDSHCGRPGNPGMAYLVQGGFPEAVHSRAVERYLDRLSRRLGCRYLGTAVKGGIEGIRTMPPRMTRKRLRRFHELGAAFGCDGAFDPKLVAELSKPERLSFSVRLLVRLFALVGAANLGWDMQLKQHGAWARSFDRPYQH